MSAILYTSLGLISLYSAWLVGMNLRMLRGNGTTNKTRNH